MNSDGGVQWQGSPRETVATREGENPVKDATKMQMSLGVRQAQTADLVFGWLPRLQLGSIKRAPVKMELARRKTCLLDRKEQSEMSYLHAAMSHPNWRSLAACVRRSGTVIKGKKEGAFCDACAFSKTTSAPVLTGRPQAESVKKTTESRLELWEETSYDVSGHYLTPSIDGGHEHELWCIDHATDTACCQGFQRPGQLHGVIEEFL